MKFVALPALYAVPALLLSPALASAKSAPAPAATPVAPKVGATVVGKDNQNAGVIVQISDQAVVIDTGTHQVPVPRAAIGSNPKGLWIGMTKAELDTAFEQAAVQAKANFVAQLTPGKAVRGLNGAMLGTIKAVDTQFVTVTTAKGDVRLSIASFGLNPDGSVSVGLTQDQLDAAIGGSVPTR